MKNAGQHIEFMCSQCPAKEPYEPSEWFSHIWFLHTLQQSGYPFRPDDLSLEQWLALGEMKLAIEELKWQTKR